MIGGTIVDRLRSFGMRGGSARETQNRFLERFRDRENPLQFSIADSRNGHTNSNPNQIIRITCQTNLYSCSSRQHIANADALLLSEGFGGPIMMFGSIPHYRVTISPEGSAQPPAPYYTRTDVEFDDRRPPRIDSQRGENELGEFMHSSSEGGFGYDVRKFECQHRVHSAHDTG